MPRLSRSSLSVIWISMAAALCIGILGRGYWTPDEPREADLAWRMSWQSAKAVPLLAGEAFCEKPPLAYWLAGASMRIFGNGAWAARLPNLLYALLTALAVAGIARRGAGSIAGAAAGAAIGTFLLSYQVAIWLATDAPLVAAVASALFGLHVGFYARGTAERLGGYTVMHLALAAAFLSKNAAAWMVPLLAFATLVVWERRWRELLRWELYLGLALQAAVILAWVWAVYAGPDGAARLKVFFWNNLVGRFAHIDAPQELQYAAGHRNVPGKYLIELPVYLWPWTLLVAAACRRAWRTRHPAGEPRQAADPRRIIRFAAACFVPALCVLSAAATARNVYLAPAMPGVALLLGWWTATLTGAHDPWDVRALRGTAVMLLIACATFAAGAAFVALDSGSTLTSPAWFVAASALGLAAALAGSLRAWRDAAGPQPLRAALALLVAYCALLVGPASQIYRGVDAWQNLAGIGRAIARDAANRQLILFAPDETTRAFIDMYARTSALLVPGPATPKTVDRLNALLAADPQALVVTRLPGSNDTRTAAALAAFLGLGQRFHAQSPSGESAPPWAAAAALRIEYRYALPNGRRYAVMARDAAAASR
jgi:4-amino-4-deoxy-L-arabinose transferase-like glycosyltransferase